MAGNSAVSFNYALGLKETAIYIYIRHAYNLAPCTHALKYTVYYITY